MEAITSTSPAPLMRFHCLALPHTVTNKEYNACAFTQKVLKFCKMMHPKHTVYHYGHEDSDVQCKEHITLITNDDLEKTYGSHNWKKEFFKFDCNDHCHKKFNELGTIEISKRYQQGDFILCFWGYGHYGIAQAFEGALVVEPGIGNYHSFSKYRVYESYACMHHTQGLQNTPNPSWYHTVIPNYFDTTDFEYSDEKHEYFLFLGRISECKGLHIAIQACEALGYKLKVAGQGPIENFKSDCIEYIGYADTQTRKKLMKHAKALLIFSDYVEPFGGVTIEAMLSGTPVICPDYGCFVETVPHGLCGFRVRTFDHILFAMKNIHKIRSFECKMWGERYSLFNIAPRYEEYFSMLLDLYGEGWYTRHDDRETLKYLCR